MALKTAVAEFARHRRLRRSAGVRRLVQETRLSAADFVYPLFVTHGQGVRDEIPSMPGQYQLSLDQIGREAAELRELGIGAVLLFGLPAMKDDVGSEAYDDAGIVQNAVREFKRADEDLVVITDVCLCEYTSHGHCGIIRDGDVDNDESIDLIARTAVSHARAGADIVAPSDMMDGRILATREALDDAGFESTPIMAYSAKYASAFYGPFREAADSAPQFGDRRGYQLDPANVREAIRECKIDLAEGADAIMIKPALPYLDVIRSAREAFDVPLAAYNVSGEYAMVKAAARSGWLDERAAALESLTAIKRAGADLIVSYWTRDLPAWLS
jgi:porphobilinogen synthase